MKELCCAALLLASQAHAGELLPMSGEDDDYVESVLAEKLANIVSTIDGTVEPILDSIHYSGRAKRILFGPLVRGGNIKLRLKVIDTSGIVTELLVTDESGAWRGTFQPGNDYAMIDRAAEAAVVALTNYHLSK
jgi:hypothetical protein